MHNKVQLPETLTMYPLIGFMLVSAKVIVMQIPTKTASSTFKINLENGKQSEYFYKIPHARQIIDALHEYTSIAYKPITGEISILEVKDDITRRYSVMSHIRREWARITKRSVTHNRKISALWGRKSKWSNLP